MNKMNITQNQKDRAKKFQEMHRQDKLFVLPNIWDAGGAKIFEKKGFQALATTSAGIAFANGFADGGELPFSILLETVRRITSKIDIPLSIDFERGYSEDIQEIYENTKKILLSGAVGLNVEDGLPKKRISDLQAMKNKIECINSLKKELGVDFVINSRTDIYWNEIGDPESRLPAAIKRVNSYFSWGADCVFVPGNISFNELKILTKEVNGPLNILLNKDLKNIDQLNALGVKRVSLGSSLSRNSMSNLFKEIEKIGKNDFDSLLSNTLPYEFVNHLYEVRKDNK